MYILCIGWTPTVSHVWRGDLKRQQLSNLMLLVTACAPNAHTCVEEKLQCLSDVLVGFAHFSLLG